MHPEILSISLFWFVTAYTPGPNNVVASYSGFNFGFVKFMTGLNSALSMEVKTYLRDNSGVGGVVSLSLSMPYDIVVGNQLEITAGCDKSFSTCQGKFNNAINFRGEPHVPGSDKAMETAGTRS